MSSDDDILLALIGMGAWRAAAAARQQAEYQRQQLNLLRRHQGLPPHPTPRTRRGPASASCSDGRSPRRRDRRRCHAPLSRRRHVAALGNRRSDHVVARRPRPTVLRPPHPTSSRRVLRRLAPGRVPMTVTPPPYLLSHERNSMTDIPDIPEADPTTTTPYIFVDVDGVLNALIKPDEPHLKRRLEVTGYQYSIHIREAVLAWLRRLAEDHDVRWATTWQDHANQILAPAFDLPELPIACRDDVGHGFSASHGGWKIAGVIAAITEDPRPFVWIDDDAIPHDVDERFAQLGVPYLCVRPDDALGLSDDEIDEIDRFLAQHR